MIIDGKEINTMKNLQSEYVDCFCKSKDHVLRFLIYCGKNEVDFYIEGNFQPNNSFWKRIKIGLGYIFSKEYDVPYTSTEFNIDQTKQIKSICERYIDIHRKNTSISEKNEKI